MTQEEKELLLKDVCARLPYGVQILYDSDKKFDDGLICQPYGLTIYNGRTCVLAFGVVDPIEIDEFKLCLRPMSSMTEEEKKEFQACHCVYGLHPDFQPMMCNLANELNMFDWLNAHHFDYRGLIGKGLAIKAPEGMYNLNNE
jgi:hypothetical protein